MAFEVEILPLTKKARAETHRPGVIVHRREVDARDHAAALRERGWLVRHYRRTIKVAGWEGALFVLVCRRAKGRIHRVRS
jgi:hypothetical protein